jgi:alkenylglycerophosphocholine hydrolase
MPESISLGGWVLVFAAISAVADWVAVIYRWKNVEYVFKPITMIALLVAAFCLAPARTDVAFRVFFLLGLFFSLLGDIALMLPNEGWFLPGLVAFLFGHLGYIRGFNINPPPPLALILAPAIVLLNLIVLRRLVDGLVAQGKDSLRIPVVVYGVVLSLTLASAWSTIFRPLWSMTARVAAVLGGTLFFVSDLMLAWDRFVRRSRLLHVLVIITYHLAQFALVFTLILAP